ncbi:PASTA domain-containing protein [Streptomyces sp. Tu102]|uniref:PASTA domain-containing protein n=1 Tax=Streptomyces sp. Tu102 TaxID=2838019 RepID=UPI001BDD039E|nr:PASTA domain-containing protein [Streptomyces sp. Tu102]MBT1093727.1 PASTA domain-containing protein [Streptomyces sp. Tu102]
MAFRVFVHRSGTAVIRRITVLLVLVLALGACDRGTPLFLVKAVAAGVPSLAPFFDENQGLGRDDEQVTAQQAPGGLQQGDTPGLYGGSEQPTVCDVVRLKEFLTDPANGRKAQAWATALSITTAEIPGYLDRLTPVLLRHDTLVKNHDYKKGKATPFNALLQTGIAILVDEQGLPAVKCSCGNPLRPFDGDTNRIKVEFDDRNDEWKGYEKSSVVAVRPATRNVERLALVEVHEPDRGITRPVGTTGEKDTAFDTRERRAVPDLAGATFGQASRELAGKGLAVAFEGGGLPPDGARVTASDPPAGTELRFGEYVTLSVAGGSSGGSSDGTTTSTPPGGSGSSPSTRDPSASNPTPTPAPSGSSPSGPSSGSGSPGPSGSGPSGSGPSSSAPGPTSGPPSSGTSSTAPPPSDAPTSSSPPATTKSPTTSSAPPPPPPSSSPPTQPTSSPPPGTGGPTASRPETTSSPGAGSPATGRVGTGALSPATPATSASTSA